MKIKLSERAQELLTLIYDFTDRDWATGKLNRYFIPNNEKWSETLKEFILVSGAGDAAALRGLERRGLIEAIRCSSPYAYAITEDGLLVIQTLLEKE